MIKTFMVLSILLAAFAADAKPAKILLTFDDGPNPESTPSILAELKKRQAKAVFFVLTGPETLFKKYPFRKTYPKAETDEGFQIVADEIRQGHLIACHWGGTYENQLNYHPRRLQAPAYDYNQDGIVDQVSEQGNALETDLMQCQDRLNQALSLVQSEDNSAHIQKPNTLHYIRPPVWKYKIDELDARPVYESLGMKMIMTDFRLVDGGYPIQGFPIPERMAAKTSKAIKNGQSEVILTLHDSNTRTARELSKTLDMLENSLKRRGLRQGIDWDYTQNIQEIETVLENYLKRAKYEE